MTFATQATAAFTPIAAVYDSASVSRALTWAQSFVEAYCDRVFDYTVGKVDIIDPKPYRSALIPARPVVNVQSVSGLLPPSTPGQAGLVWTALTNFAFIPDTGFLYDTTGEPGTYWQSNLLSWPTVRGGLRVTYDVGYPVVPQGLVDVACRLAQQYLENPALQMQRSTGDVEARFSGSAGVKLNEFDKIILDRHADIGIA